MAKRSHMSKRKSSKDFKKKSGIHPKNSLGGSGASVMMRGGIRL